MIEVPKSYGALASITIDTIRELNEKISPKKRKPLSEAVLDFGQLLCLIAVAGGEELDDLAKE